MIRYKETFLSNFTPKQLFDLVADIESYPKFLPWCSEAKIIHSEQDSCIAELVLYFAPLSYKYTSKVDYDRNAPSINVSLVEGPFECLNNIWNFKEQNGKTQIDFSIELGCKSKMLEKMVGLMFERALAKLISAFQKRAEELYGSGS